MTSDYNRLPFLDQFEQLRKAGFSFVNVDLHTTILVHCLS